MKSTSIEMMSAWDLKPKISSQEVAMTASYVEERLEIGGVGNGW